MTKLAQIKKCLSNIWNCRKFWVGSGVFIIISGLPRLFNIPGGFNGAIFLITYILVVLSTIVGISEYYWPDKDTGETKE